LRTQHELSVFETIFCRKNGPNGLIKVVFLRHTVRLAPASAEGHNNLGLALSELGRFAEAEACYQEALRLNPRYADAHNNLGSAYKEQGRFEEALACYQLALWLSPDMPSVRWNRSLALLQMGRFEEGWPEYEWRWKRRQMKPRASAKPRWDGTPLEGRTLLIYMEQGLGDMIQSGSHRRHGNGPPGRGPGRPGLGRHVHDDRLALAARPGR
jgi:tetratricopeptide (TPR) repeat protein